ncbi:hypothetical protein [Chachezhania antarctica]|uniref:hypothetical protein n=1 Tax=Chachezhania antarctica TaxID=2340860 RepID=UPI0013CF2D35|nr:hypothetical protein [Chachezhania antarctica]
MQRLWRVLRPVVAGWAAITLVGCGSADTSPPVRQAVSRAAVPVQAFAGDVAFYIAHSIASPKGALPVELYLGFKAETETRIGLNAAVDLRQIQRDLPILLSGRKDPDCRIGLTVRLDRTEAEDTSVRAKGSVTADLYRCKGHGTPDAVRGIHLLTQTVKFDALMGAGLKGQCVEFELRQLQIDPTGFLGWLSTAVGATDRIREAILEHGNKALRDTPICPKIPPTLAVLEPELAHGGPFEIGDGGLGLDLAGSVSTGSAQLITMLDLLQKNGHLPKAPADMPAPTAPTVAFRFDNSLKAAETPLEYQVELGMTSVAPTRIGLGATLDLRDIQQNLPTLFAGTVLVDNCAARVELKDVDLAAEGETVIASAKLEARSYDCARTGAQNWERGDETRVEDIDVRAAASVTIEDNCAIFQLVDLGQDSSAPVDEDDKKAALIAAARTAFVQGIDLLLTAHPLCPELPVELQALDPQFTQGSPHEVGQGGLGLGVKGSVDLSAETIISLLQVLQQKGVLPPAP